MTAVVYVLTSGCAWRRLPAVFGIAVPTAYRRFVEWTGACVWDRLCDAADTAEVEVSLSHWAKTIRDAACARLTVSTPRERTSV